MREFKNGILLFCQAPHANSPAPIPPDTNNLLLENGFKILLENGDSIALEG